MPATRTEVRFTEEQRRRLDSLALREGRTLADVVRSAVDAYLATAPPDRERVLEETFGSMPDLEVPNRGDWERGFDPADDRTAD